MSEFELKAWVEWIWGEWISQKPESVRKAAEAYPPGRYKLLIDGKESVVEYVLIGYTEQDDKTVTAILETEGLMGMLPRQVYGVKLDELIAVEPMKTREIL